TLSPDAERMPAESHQPELELQPPGLRRWKNGWILAGQLDRSPRVLGPIDASLLLLAGCSLPGLRPLLLVDALPDVPKPSLHDGGDRSRARQHGHASAGGPAKTRPHLRRIDRARHRLGRLLHRAAKSWPVRSD